MNTRILIVEDEPLMAEALSLHLEHLGYQVQGIAPSAGEALEAISAECPDLILMDIILQGPLDGIEAAQLIRVQFDIPILYLTAYADPHLFQRAKITEPFAYLLKPFNQRELHLTIEMALYRQRTEKRLRSSESHLAEAQHVAHLGSWEWDMQSDRVTWSDETYRLFDVTPEQFDGSYQGFIDLMHEADREKIQAAVSHVLADKHNQAELDFRIMLPDGQTRILHSIARLHFEAASPAAVMIGTVQDVTAQRRMKEQLREAHGQLELRVAERTRELRQANELLQNEIQERQRVSQELRSSEARYRTLVEHSPDALFVNENDITTYANPAAARLLGRENPEDLLGLTARDVVHPDYLATMQQRIAKAREHGTSNPFIEYKMLRADGRPVDVESVSFPCEYNGKPAVVAWARDISARKAAEQQAHRFQIALDSSADSIFLVDRARMRFIDMNATARNVLGFSREELLSMGPHHIKPYYNQAMLARRFDEIIASDSKSGRIETWHIRKDDTLFPVEINLRAIESDGCWLMVSIARDVSQRKIAEQELLDSEQRFRQLAENIHEVFWLRDAASGKILYVSPSYEDIWGRQRDALYERPRSFLSAVHPDDRKQVWAFFDGQSGKHTPAGEEFRITRPDGGIRWVWAKVFPIADDKGKTYRYAGVAEDITERKQAEITLRESEERFRQLAENIQGVFWIRDVALDKIIYASPAFESIWGTPLSVLHAHPRAFIDAVHAEDKSRVIEAFTRQKEQQVWFNEEFRICRPDGTVRWIWSRAFPVRDEHGTVYRIAGIAEDITRQKQAEFALRQSEETARLLIEHAPVGIALVGRDYKFSSVNQALCAMLGYTAQEFYERTFADVTHADDLDADISMAKKLFSGEIPNYTIEKRYLRKSGEAFWIHLVAAVIHDQDGKPLHGMAIIEDITDRREAESQQLAALEMQRDALVREVHHRIKNNLQGVVGLMRQYATEHPAVAGLTNDIASKIFAVAVVHGLQSRYTTEEIELGDMLGEIGQTVAATLGSARKPCMSQASAPSARINRNEAVPVALILNELLVNACKHAHDGTAPPAVSIAMLHDKAALSIRITNQIEQQQPGFDFMAGKGLGTGLTLVKSLLPRQGATLQFHRDAQHLTAELQLSAPVIMITPPDPHTSAAATA